ncbi:hypothetical protein U1Q18_009496 [Sarracenia purpurea var. burkii]
MWNSVVVKRRVVSSNFGSVWELDLERSLVRMCFDPGLVKKKSASLGSWKFGQLAKVLYYDSGLGEEADELR